MMSFVPFFVVVRRPSVRPAVGGAVPVGFANACMQRTYVVEAFTHVSHSCCTYHHRWDDDISLATHARTPAVVVNRYGKGHTGYKSWNHLPQQLGFDDFVGFLGGAQDHFSPNRWGAWCVYCERVRLACVRAHADLRAGFPISVCEYVPVCLVAGAICAHTTYSPRASYIGGRRQNA